MSLIGYWLLFYHHQQFHHYLLHLKISSKLNLKKSIAKVTKFVRKCLKDLLQNETACPIVKQGKPLLQNGSHSLLQNTSEFITKQTR